MIERFIDAHHHLWDLSEHRYPWLRPPLEPVTDELTALRRDYDAPTFLAQVGSAPLRGSVHVEAAFDPADPVAETRWVARQAEAWGVPTVAVAAARLQQPNLEQILAAHQEHSLVRGIRQMLNWTPTEPVAERDGLLEDRAWLRGLSVLGRLGLSFDLQVFPHQLDLATKVIAGQPETSFVLDHGGFGQMGTPARLALWKRGISRLAKLPNVTVKASSYVSIDPTFSLTGLTDYLLTLINAFGADRVMFASNFPVDGRYLTYEQLLDQYDKALAALSDSERDAIFYRTAAIVYRIPDQPRPVDRGPYNEKRTK